MTDWRVFAFSLFLFPVTGFSFTAEEKAHEQGITDIATARCNSEFIEGKDYKVTALGNGKIEVHLIGKKGGSLEGTFQYTNAEWQGRQRVLQENQASENKDRRRCIQEEADSLRKTYKPPTPQPTSYSGKNSDLVSFLAWNGTGSFTYTGGSCKGCSDKEKFTGTGTFRPEVRVKDPQYIKRIDFLRNGATLSTVWTPSLVSGSNTLSEGIGHTLIKVDGSRDNYYGGRTSYCWSGTPQACVARASDTKEMMQFVTYRLNLDSYKIRVTTSEDKTFDIYLPPVSY